MKLSDLHTGEEGIITKITGRGAFRRRIMEMGFVRGKSVVVIKNAPLKDPIEYCIMGYNVSLRRSEASLLDVVTVEEAREVLHDNYTGTIDDETLKKTAQEKGRVINIALVGNPNSGKTTLFNAATNSREHVGNYSGVTVEMKQAQIRFNGYTLNLFDLPGTYSLTAYSPEEITARRFIINEKPDVVINVIDASNLERNLYLTTQLIDMDIKVVAALNMYDELHASGVIFDFINLGKMIGIPFIPTVGSKGFGLKDLLNKVVDVYEDRDTDLRHIHINYGNNIEPSIKNIQDVIWKDPSITDMVSSRFYAIKLLERDKEIIRDFEQSNLYLDLQKTVEHEIKCLEEKCADDSESVITDAKYGFIAGALKETYSGSTKILRYKTTKIDHILTHKYWGYPVFFLFMWLMFNATFRLGEYPMEWIESLFSTFGNLIDTNMQTGPLKDLLINGIIDGVGGVLVFLPNILILFFFISLMEDSGYMARVAFIMDKLMHKIGLHGQSFIPLIMGFGCNVPAIMATRTIKSRNNRLLTMLINPLMSCSARLPVYVLIISAFFPRHAGTTLFMIYLTGISIAILSALLLKKIVFRTDDTPFVMELPPYRIPTTRSILIHMWGKASEYLKKIGGVILIASVLIWALGYYPRNEELLSKYKEQIVAVNNETKVALSSGSKDSSIHKQILAQAELTTIAIEKEMQSEHQAHSYIGRIGQFIEPVMKPLGFDWRLSIALLAGVTAKEIVVSTMSVLFQATDDSNESLKTKIQDSRWQSGNRIGQKIFSPLVAISLLLFVLIYFPCIGVIAAIQRESGHWKWAFFTVFYTTGLAWLAAFITFQVGSMLGY